MSDTQQWSFPQSTQKTPSDHRLSTGLETGQTDRHAEKPGPDHQLDLLQLMPHGRDGHWLGAEKGRNSLKAQSWLLTAGVSTASLSVCGSDGELFTWQGCVGVAVARGFS